MVFKPLQHSRIRARPHLQSALVAPAHTWVAPGWPTLVSRCSWTFPSRAIALIGIWSARCNPWVRKCVHAAQQSQLRETAEPVTSTHLHRRMASSRRPSPRSLLRIAATTRTTPPGAAHHHTRSCRALPMRMGSSDSRWDHYKNALVRAGLPERGGSGRYQVQLG